ncbi:TetR/AcrR family transcriptional regulator [Streptomyces sp. B3I7]|uniref:TetR/AcrR family transcriptional regulator n=1 Tax=Streptomyces sp. B3I7 TaxID=3042269 RepID=UPI0027D8A4DF|nr:helix-turn-helix domain-containing protein [Streptomyces sp. B3I7]
MRKNSAFASYSGTGISSTSCHQLKNSSSLTASSWDVALNGCSGCCTCVQSSGDRTARAVIRDEALRLFAVRGSEGVTARQIAEAAGVSAGSSCITSGARTGCGRRSTSTSSMCSKGCRESRPGRTGPGSSILRPRGF